MVVSRVQHTRGEHSAAPQTWSTRPPTSRLTACHTRLPESDPAAPRHTSQPASRPSPLPSRQSPWCQVMTRLPRAWKLGNLPSRKRNLRHSSPRGMRSGRDTVGCSAVRCRSRCALPMAALVLALLLGLMQARYASAAVKGKSAGAAAFAEIDDDEEEGVAPQSPPPAGTRVKEGNNLGGAASSSSPPPPRGGQKRRGPVSTSALLEDLENFDQYDEDEFEGLEALKAVKTQANAAAGSDAGGESKKGPKTRMMRRTEPSDFIFEGLGILYVLLYIINYVWGSSQNRAVAEEWLEACMDKLQENFALVGIENRGDLEREAADEYSLYCSGRVNCASVTITLKLKPRHDLLMYIWGMVQGQAFEDVVMIKAELGSDANTGGNMDALTLAVFPKKDEKKVRPP